MHERRGLDKLGLACGPLYHNYMANYISHTLVPANEYAVAEDPEIEKLAELPFDIDSVPETKNPDDPCRRVKTQALFTDVAVLSKISLSELNIDLTVDKPSC